MADAGLFVGFGQPVRGREERALRVFQEAVAYWSSLQASGEIEGFDAVLLEVHGGDLDGFFLLRGERARLAGLRASEGFRRLVTRAELIVDNVGVVGALLGEGLEQELTLYGAAVSELAHP